MSTAQQILVVYGVVIIAYGFVLGVPLAAARSKSPHASRHLVTTHLSALMQGPVCLGLAFAFGATTFTSTAATIAAVMVVAGLTLEALGGTANWLQSVTDQFAEKSLGFRLNSASGPVAIIGIAIAAVGVISGL